MVDIRKWTFIIFILFLTGCNFNHNVQQNDNTPMNQQPMQIKNSTVQNIDRKTGQEIAQHLVDLASRVPKVNDATAVVLGNYALVGIDVDEDLERSEVGMIKYSVAESLKKDRYGAQAIVIADPDMTARLREIGDDIKNGKPIQGIFNELADISGRLMPEIPQDIFEPDTRGKGGNEPEKHLNEKDKNNIEKQQEEQSNHHLKGN